MKDGAITTSVARTNCRRCGSMRAMSPGITLDIAPNLVPLSTPLLIRTLASTSPAPSNPTSRTWPPSDSIAFGTRVSRQTAGQVDMHSIIPQMPQPLAGTGGLPAITIPGFAGLYESAGGGDNEQTYEFTDTLTWAKGKHLVEAGFSYMHWKFTNYGLGDNGAFTFDGYYTSGGNSTAPNYDAFADYLLGDLSGVAVRRSARVGHSRQQPFWLLYHRRLEADVQVNREHGTAL